MNQDWERNSLKLSLSYIVLSTGITSSIVDLLDHNKAKNNYFLNNQTAFS